MSETLLVIASSAPPDRKAYSRDLLDCLCYPAGHTAHFSYRAKWVEPGLFTRKIDPGGAPALIVLCDESKSGVSGFEFIPLRRARLLAIEPRSVLEAGQQDENTYITLRFELGPFVQLAPKTSKEDFARWNNWVKAGSPQPFPRDHASAASAKFVFERSGFEERATNDQQASWRELAEKIASTQSLANDYLFRVASVETRDRRGGLRELAPQSLLEHQGYRVDAPGSYVVNLAWQHAAKPAPVAASSSESVVLTGPLSSSFGRHTEARLLVRVGRVYEEETVTVVLAHQDRSVSSPVANLLFILRPARWLLPTIVALLSIGALMTGVSKDVVAELTSAGSWANSNAAAIAWLLKAAGAVAVGTGGYMGFRRLPKGMGL